MNLCFTTLAEQRYGFQQKYCFFVDFTLTAGRAANVIPQVCRNFLTCQHVGGQHIRFYNYFTGEGFWEKLLDFNQAIAQKWLSKWLRQKVPHCWWFDHQHRHRSDYLQLRKRLFVYCCLVVVKIVVINLVKITCSCGRGPPFAKIVVIIVVKRVVIIVVIIVVKIVVKIVVIIVAKITCSCGRGPPFALLFLARAELESSFGFFTVNGWSCVWYLMMLVKMLKCLVAMVKMPRWLIMITTVKTGWWR